VAAAPRLQLIVTMPERMSAERAALLRYLGAEVVTTPGTLMREAVARAEELRQQIPGALVLGQFSNPANPDIHRRTTAVESLGRHRRRRGHLRGGRGHGRHHHRRG
jgi:cysteine synthase A